MAEEEKQPQDPVMLVGDTRQLAAVALPRPPRAATGIAEWIPDAILLLGALGCCAVAAGFVAAPFSEAEAPPVAVTTPATDSDLRLGAWTSPVSTGSRWIRTVKVSSGGVHALRVSFTVDYVASNGVPVTGVLGEYAANALLLPDGKAQAIDSEQICQISAGWTPDGALTIQQKSPCGEIANIAADGILSGTYRKMVSDPPKSPIAARPDCSHIPAAKAEEKLFCSDPALQTAREVTSAVYADSLSQLRAQYPEQTADFEQADRAWQAEVSRVCLTAASTPEDPEGAKLTCFGQSYDARMNWLRLHTGLLHLAQFTAKDPERGVERYAEALSGYADTYGTQALRLPVFARRMQPILPAEELAGLDAALANRGPRGGLFQSGCGPLGCDHQEGAFEINPQSNSITVALRRGPRITVYAPDGESADLPASLHQWLEKRSGSVSDILYKP